MSRSSLHIETKIYRRRELAGKVKSICMEKIVPIIEDMGYETIEVEYSKQVDGMNLIFYIDKDEGVTIDDCEKVTKVIDPILDELDPTDNKPYILSVSSPGIDRPLKTERDFKRNMGKEIEITLFSKLDGKKLFKGELKSFSESEVTIFDGKNDITLKRNLIANIVPIIKF